MKRILLICLVVIVAFSSCVENNKELTSEQRKAYVDSLMGEGEGLTSLADTITVDTTTVGNNEIFLEIEKERQDKIKTLKPFFKFSKDEFSNVTWVKSRNEPRYRNVNALYCYFGVVNDRAENLRFVLQYQADDWLFIKNYIFSIDGETYNFIPNKVESDNNGDGIYEWSDDYVTSGLASILKKVVNSKSAKIKMNGSKYYEVKVFSAKHKLDIKRTLELYKEMKGDQLIGY